MFQYKLIGFIVLDLSFLELALLQTRVPNVAAMQLTTASTADINHTHIF
jgi:hypothetical protein